MNEALVVPCFDEETRLDRGALDELLARSTLSLVLVDDGSRDGTLRVLERYADTRRGRVTVLPLGKNRGKAEAVRRGIQCALSLDARFVGYADADFATPPKELVRLLDLLHGGDYDLVFGSRVRTFGTDIHRVETRHLLGRVFATAASLTLGEAIYDTQCGAKWMRRTAALEHAVAEPFVSNWAFDVELFARLFGKLGGPPLDRARCREVPLYVWRDVAESKVKLGGMARSLADLLRIYAQVRRDR